MSKKYRKAFGLINAPHPHLLPTGEKEPFAPSPARVGEGGGEGAARVF